VPPGREDVLEAAVRSTLDPHGACARVWLAAWRAALMCTLDGFSVDTARSALARFNLDDR
jgi:hypothetical protein